MGFSVVTTVLSKAVSADLTTLAIAKDELSLSSSNTADDAWLSRAISQVSQTVASFTKRTFAPETVEDAFDIEQDPYPYQTPGGFAQLQLTRWPVLGVSSVDQTLAPGTMQALTEGIDFRVDPATGQMLRLNPFTGVGTTWEAMPVTVRYTAGFGALVTEPAAVPAAAPYAITVASAATFSCDQSVRYASGEVLTRVAASPTAGQYSVAAGTYTFNAADADQTLTIAYATSAMPADLVDVALRLITARYKAKDRDPALIQMDTPGVGTQRWWFGGAPGQKGPFTPDIEAMLEPYYMPVVA